MISEKPLENFNPKHNVVACYIEHNGKILLIRRKLDDEYEGGKWGVPAGSIDSGEDAITALQREIFEEIGISLDKNKFVHKATFYVRYDSHDFKHNVYVYKNSTKLNIKLGEDHTEYIWLTPTDALKIDLVKDEDTCLKTVYGI